MISLRTRLLIGLVLGLLGLLSASAALLYGTTRARVWAQLDHNLEGLAGVLGEMIEQDRGQLDFELSAEVARSGLLSGRRIQYRILDGAGAVLFETEAAAAALGAPPEPPPCAWDTTLADGAPARAMARVFRPRREPVDRLLGKEAPELQLVIAQDASDSLRYLAGLRWAYTVGGALTAGAMALLVLLVVRGALRPLDRLAAAAGRIDASTLEQRFPERVPAELEPITRRWNELLARLQAAFTRERAFNAAVAHELRTPVAELRALAESAQRQAARAGRPAELAADALAIAQQMERIVTGLLALKRYEAGEARPQPAAHALAPLLRAGWSELRELPAKRGLDLQLELPPDLALWADQKLLATILHVLLENAAQHAPAHSGVRATAVRAGGQIVLDLANLAPELTEDDLPHLFEAFWRKDGARSGNGHLGLGLHLAAAAARAAGMTLEAHLQPSGILHLRLRGPAAPESAASHFPVMQST